MAAKLRTAPSAPAKVTGPPPDGAAGGLADRSAGAETRVCARQRWYGFARVRGRSNVSGPSSLRSDRTRANISVLQPPPREQIGDGPGGPVEIAYTCLASRFQVRQADLRLGARCQSRPLSCSAALRIFSEDLAGEAEPIREGDEPVPRSGTGEFGTILLAPERWAVGRDESLPVPAKKCRAMTILSRKKTSECPISGLYKQTGKETQWHRTCTLPAVANAATKSRPSTRRRGTLALN
jgi:hypothetical protein